MKDISDLIKYENENTCLDFKLSQYKKSQFKNFIKDIISMANADTDDDKFIIIGIHIINGNKKIKGIAEKMTDSATYQQLIEDNVEPTVKFEYVPFLYEGKQLAYFRIFDCHDKPFMMKKEYDNLKRGDSLIRKGTHQTRLTRRDLDIIFNKRFRKEYFMGNIEFGFSDNDFNKAIKLPALKDYIQPSKVIAEKIQEIIKKKETENSTQRLIFLLFEICTYLVTFHTKTEI